MKENASLTLILEAVRGVANGSVRARALVELVDELVANDKVSSLDAEVSKLIDELHTGLALYTSDEPSRQKEPLLIGSDELRRQLLDFESRMRKLGY